jgi:hypothetical protein
MDRWADYRAGKLILPAIVQSDVSGVLVAVTGGFVGPYPERKGWKAADYVALAESLVADTPAPEPDYRVKYVELQKAVDSIDTKALKGTIVIEVSKLQTKTTVEEVSK